MHVGVGNFGRVDQITVRIVSYVEPVILLGQRVQVDLFPRSDFARQQRNEIRSNIVDRLLKRSSVIRVIQIIIRIGALSGGILNRTAGSVVYVRGLGGFKQPLLFENVINFVTHATTNEILEPEMTAAVLPFFQFIVFRED